MIRPLRSRHRWMIGALAVIAGPLLVTGLLTSRTDPAVGRLPSDAGASADGLLQRAAVRIDSAVEADGGVTLEVEARRPLPEADLGLYWVPEVGGLPRHLPKRSYWLGTLDGDARSYRIPDEARTSAGTLILYDRDRREVRDAVSLSLPAGGR